MQKYQHKPVALLVIHSADPLFILSITLVLADENPVRFGFGRTNRPEPDSGSPERIDRNPLGTRSEPARNRFGTRLTDGPKPIRSGSTKTLPQKPVVPFRRFLTVVFARCQVDPGARAAAAGASADAEEHSVQLEP